MPSRLASSATEPMRPLTRGVEAAAGSLNFFEQHRIGIGRPRLDASMANLISSPRRPTKRRLWPPSEQGKIRSARWPVRRTRLLPPNQSVTGSQPMTRGAPAGKIDGPSSGIASRRPAPSAGHAITHSTPRSWRGDGEEAGVALFAGLLSNLRSGSERGRWQPRS